MSSVRDAALHPAPRGWHQPVRPGALILVGITVLLVWLVMLSGAIWYFYEAWEARLAMRDQPVMLRLPEGLQAAARVTSPIRTRVDLHPGLTLNIDQTVTARIKDSLFAHARLDTTLPVDTTVQVDTVVPVRTTLALSVSLKSWLPRVHVTVPLTIELPVRMTVPVKADVPVALDIDASGELPGTLVVPVRGTFALRPHVRGDVDARMDALTLFSLSGPLEPFRVRIERADLRLPFQLGVRRRPLPDVATAD